MGKLKRKPKTDEERIQKVADAAKMNVFFHQVWDREENKGYCYCYECGIRLSRSRCRDNHGYFHHLLYKETFPEYKYCEENLKIICLNCHTQTHIDRDKTPKIKELTKILLQRHTEDDETLCAQE